MPELPEVETMRRGIASVIGKTIQSAALVKSNYRPILVSPRQMLCRRLEGRVIVDTGRLGKRVLLHLDDEQILAFEPRMTGLVLVTDPPNQEHLRFVAELSGRKSPRLMFWDRRGLGTIHLLTPKAFDQKWGPHVLGPDALRIDGTQLRQRLGKSRRPIKPALLDQKAVAGIGNLYAAEILFEAEVDPRLRCDRVTKKQWDRIAEWTIHVLQKAIQYEGSTLSDGTYRNALNQSGQYQNHHRVYDRAGSNCSRCETGVITRIVQAQRATFFCPGCQRKKS